MSEYQYVAFQAVDRPLDDKQLEFAERQSTRAEVSRWQFSVEYNYSSFHGDVDGLLRRGYDVFLQYTNYGNREIKMRLPNGLPFEKKVWSKYVDGERLTWKKDAKKPAGILTLHPFHEELDQVWDFGRYVDAAVRVRQQLVEGDLRALYLLWLCAADDDYEDPCEVIEPPVPGGLGQLVDTCGDFLDFFELDPLLLQAAAEGSGESPEVVSRDQQVADWVGGISADDAKRHLAEFILGDPAAVRAELLSAIRDSGETMAWPVVHLGRTMAALMERTDALRRAQSAKEERQRKAKEKREAAKAERERQERMKQMLKDPQQWLRKAGQLVDQRGTDNYRAAADILADLREAVGGDEGEKITRKQAAHLAKKHPTLNILKSSLRKRGLLS